MQLYANYSRLNADSSDNNITIIIFKKKKNQLLKSTPRLTYNPKISQIIPTYSSKNYIPKYLNFFACAFILILPGRVAQSIKRLSQEPVVPGSKPSLATYFRFPFR